MGLCFRCRDHSATLISAMPIGIPGCPEFACCTASIVSTRIALAIRAEEAGDEIVMYMGTSLRTIKKLARKRKQRILLEKREF